MHKPKKTIPFTPEKYAAMQQKVAELQKLREEVMERLIIAREMGDLSENGAYKYAKFELGTIGRQLKQLNHLLEVGFPQERLETAAEVVDFGSVVTIKKNDGSGIQKTFTVVSKHESNPVEGLLAYTSPMGKAVLKKKTGAVVSIQTPRGISEYTIISIE
ncbi:MAG: GreA/GreB family elongation factor [Pseudomonadales bacterium]|nr:GreA/GreB family elongation factor [Candidatus Woesebacteria bacterium]MCB9800720.1 GreA/GreB family elongation factor [Pseudomonadales bacterium]